MKEQTKNYNLFKVHECNVVYDESNLRKLRASMKARNMLEFKPIVVDRNFHVIDGKHRLKIAKELDIPVWYVQDMQATDEDIILLNTAVRTWKIEDYLEYYIAKGNENYIAFKRFCKKNNLTYRVGLVSLVGNASRSKIYTAWKSGKFDFEKYSVKESEESLKKVNDVIDYIHNKSLGTSKTWVNSVRVRESLINIFTFGDFDYEIFKKKLELNLDKVRHCASLQQSVEMWRAIYNWRNANPI